MVYPLFSYWLDHCITISIHTKVLDNAQLHGILFCRSYCMGTARLSGCKVASIQQLHSCYATQQPCYMCTTIVPAQLSFIHTSMQCSYVTDTLLSIFYCSSTHSVCFSSSQRRNQCRDGNLTTATHCNTDLPYKVKMQYLRI